MLMGCDIHTITEAKTSDGWKAALLDKPIFDWRSYRMYGFLADVRNYSEAPPIHERRDWPEDITPEAKDLREHWDMNAHSFTYVTLTDLLVFDYTKPVEDRRVTKQIAPNLWDGGATAEPGEGKMTTYRDFLDGTFFTELDRLSELGHHENVRVLMFFDC